MYHNFEAADLTGEGEGPSRTQLHSILRVEWRLLGGLCTALIVQAGVSMAQPWPLKVIFDHIILDQPIAERYVQLLGPYWEPISQNLLTIMIAAMIVIALMNGVGLYIQNITLIRLSQRVVQKLRVRLFGHVLSLPIRQFREMEAGEVIERITTDTDDTQKLVEGISILVCRSVPTFLGIAGIMFWVDWQLALITLAIAPILVWATYFFGGRIKRAAREKRQRESDIASLTEVATKTHKWIKLLGLEDDEIERMEEKSFLSREAAVEAGGWQGFYTSITNIVLSIGRAVLVLFGVWSISAGRIQPGTLLVFMDYLRSVYKPIREFTKYFIKITKARACNERIEEFMALSPCELGICNDTDADPLPPFGNSIEFDRVHYSYNAGNPIIRDLSLRIEKGQKAGLVGDSGSGKSTLLNLIPRFFDVDKGAIRIDGRDLRSVTMESLKKQIVMVPQEAVLFQMSVMDNIAVGRPGEACTEDEIREAAEKANAHDFIMDLRDGYDTVLESGAARLSGGQAKRILIARAFLRDARIVLLDEPTAALDPSSEQDVMEAFDRLSEKKTLLVASHRLPAVVNSDIIVFLRDGRIIEQGTHHELLQKKGAYAEFWKEQVGI